MAEAIRVKGLRELNNAFKRLEGDISGPAIRNELKTVAEPVAAAAKQKISRYQGASINTIRPRATARSVFVTQGKRKVTGKRSDFGSLQMRVGLMPALDENENEVVRGLEHILDRLGMEAGF